MFTKYTHILNFIKICPVEVELSDGREGIKAGRQAGVQTEEHRDMKKLTVAFRNVAKEPVRAIDKL
jgi:hypothetical protein